MTGPPVTDPTVLTASNNSVSSDAPPAKTLTIIWSGLIVISSFVGIVGSIFLTHFILRSKKMLNRCNCFHINLIIITIYTSLVSAPVLLAIEFLPQVDSVRVTLCALRSSYIFVVFVSHLSLTCLMFLHYQQIRGRLVEYLHANLRWYVAASVSPWIMGSLGFAFCHQHKFAFGLPCEASSSVPRREVVVPLSLLQIIICAINIGFIAACVKETNKRRRRVGVPRHIHIVPDYNTTSLNDDLFLRQNQCHSSSELAPPRSIAQITVMTQLSNMQTYQPTAAELKKDREMIVKLSVMIVLISFTALPAILNLIPLKDVNRAVRSESVHLLRHAVTFLLILGHCVYPMIFLWGKNWRPRFLRRLTLVSVDQTE